jgi:hypothetical protein
MPQMYTELYFGKNFELQLNYYTVEKQVRQNYYTKNCSFLIIKWKFDFRNCTERLSGLEFQNIFG